jgi:short-subunit dehydrogenase
LQDDAIVIINGRSEERTREAADRLKLEASVDGQVKVLVADLSTPAGAEIGKTST